MRGFSFLLEMVTTGTEKVKNMAPRARFELATLRLTAECSTVELPGIRWHCAAHSNTREECAPNEWHRLLDARAAGRGDHQRIEDGQDAPAILQDAVHHRPRFRDARCLTLPARHHVGGNVDVPAELLRRMPAQEQAVEEGRLPLRVVKIAQRFWVQLRHLCARL